MANYLMKEVSLEVAELSAAVAGVLELRFGSQHRTNGGKAFVFGIPHRCEAFL